LGKKAPEHSSPREKNIYEVKDPFFSYLSAFFQKIENFKPIFSLISRVGCHNQFVLQIQSCFDQLYAGLTKKFQMAHYLFFPEMVVLCPES
jgi:hypothetical protein